MPTDHRTYLFVKVDNSCDYFGRDIVMRHSKDEVGRINRLNRLCMAGL